MNDNALKVLADGKIARVADVFSRLGDLQLFDGYEIMKIPQQVRDANVLITRSVTKIDRNILDHANSLLAVASPTIGTDHVDFNALEEYRKRTKRLCPFFNAKGATAGGVADFALCAILLCAEHLGVKPQELKVGIWGVGNCGGALAKRLWKLGVPFVGYDPPKAESEGFKSCSVDEILDCDVISLHVPLTYPEQSRWPTYHMIDWSVLKRVVCKKRRVLINTSRGAVIDNQALKECLQGNPDLLLCIDVYENEPTPDETIVKIAFLATPHSAGSVIEGRLKSVKIIYDALRGFLGIDAEPLPDGFVPVSPVGPFKFPEDMQAFKDAVGLESLSRTFKKQFLEAPPHLRARVFDSIRISAERHEVRWEFD
jgi:erythronate-4-phosphate dehydrogenase